MISTSTEEKLLPWMTGLAALALITLIVLSGEIPTASSPVQDVEQPSGTLGERIQAGDAEPPPFTDDIKARLAKSSGFQHVVSYTDQGFEPSRLVITQGEVIRFTNNSSRDLWVVAMGDGGSIYPYTDRADGCGISDLDSCSPLPPQDFWEFAFTERGEWSYANASDKSHRAVVLVQ